MTCPILNRHATIELRSKPFCQSSQKCKGLAKGRISGHRQWPATDTARVRHVATWLIRGSRIAGSPDKPHNPSCHVGKGRYPKADRFAPLTLRYGHPESRRRHGKELQYAGVPSNGHAQTTANIADTQRALGGQR